MTHEDGVKHPVPQYKMYGKTNMSQETILVLVSAGIRTLYIVYHLHCIILRNDVTNTIHNVRDVSQIHVLR